MKSVLLTFLMFLVVFGLLQPSVVSAFDGSWFPIVSFMIFMIVIGIAVFMFGMPTKKNIKDALNFEKREEDDNNDKK